MALKRQPHRNLWVEATSGSIHGQIRLDLLGKRRAAVVGWRDSGKMVCEEKERWNAAGISGKAKKKEWLIIAKGGYLEFFSFTSHLVIWDPAGSCYPVSIIIHHTSIIHDTVIHHTSISEPNV